MTPITTPAHRSGSPGWRMLVRPPWIWFVLTLVVVLAGTAADRHRNARAAGPTEEQAAKPGAAAADTTILPHRVIAYYFHTTYRCTSCKKIEAYSREAIETGFSEALKDGRLVWQEVNIETKGNEHFVKDYQLYTKALILVDERSGRQEQWKNLTKVWELLGDKEKFVNYVQTETRAYLPGKP